MQLYWATKLELFKLPFSKVSFVAQFNILYYNNETINFE